MKKSNIKINYLYNSAFKIETREHVLIFDYYLDKGLHEALNSSSGVIGYEDLKTGKDIYVFCSHSHGDHYNEIIFSWHQTNPNIRYILSSDINIESIDGNINKISPYEELIMKDVHIKSYGSTDLGVSFLIKVEDITIFHAGDLNWWHWYDESEEWNCNIERLYKKEIAKIKENNIDIAFFPVDSRLKESYNLGPNYFIKEVRPKILIPMHFRDDYYITKQFSNSNRFDNTKVVEIARKGEEFNLLIEGC